MNTAVVSPSPALVRNPVFINKNKNLRQFNLRTLGLVLTLVPIVALAQDLNFKDGRWHIGVVTEIRGAKMRAPDPLLYEHCFTRADIEPHLTSSDAPCRAIEIRKSEREMSWRLQCREDAGDIKGQGRIRFLGDRIEGAIITILPNPRDNTRVIQRISGRRAGVCDLPGTPMQRRLPSALPEYR